MKKIFSFFAIAAVVLTMVGCNDNPPSDVTFSFAVNPLENNLFEIVIEPSNGNVTYFWDYLPAEDVPYIGENMKEVATKAIQSIIAQMEEGETFEDLIATVDQFSGGITKANREFAAGTEYCIYACVVNKNLEVVGEVASYAYVPERQYTHKDKIEGCLPGLFAISETEQVYFSKGNLWSYKQGVNPQWRFATYQYSVEGVGRGVDPSSYYIQDLFCWNTADDPLATSFSGNFKEWGNNPIYYGGGMTGMWRTLTAIEWKFLFCSRPHAAELVGMGHIIDKNSNQINGVFLLPDNWTKVKPEGVNFVSCEEKGMTVAGRYVNNNGDSFSHNEFIANPDDPSVDTWSAMEEAGVVFLPACGSTTSDSPYGVFRKNAEGNYWSATNHNGSDAYCVAFGAMELSPYYPSSRSIGQSVRLVR